MRWICHDGFLERRHLNMQILYRLLPLLCAAALAGCGSLPLAGHDRSGTPSSSKEQFGLAQLKQSRPADIRAATAMEIGRQDYVQAELKAAQQAGARGSDHTAIEHLNNAQQADPGNFKVRQELRRLQQKARTDAALGKARSYGEHRQQEALEILGRILSEQPNHAQARRLRDELLRADEAKRSMHPQLSASLRKQVSLNFKSQQIATIFESISRVSGVNFVFDGDVDVNRTASIFAEKTTTESAINLLLKTNQLEKKVLDRNTLLVYPATPEKARSYQDYAVRTFFLSHADAKAVVSALRQVIKPKDVYVDERVNAVIVRDKPDSLIAAERIVMGLDIPQSEVTLDVQILEVNMNDSVDLGVQYPEKLQFGPALDAASGKLTLGDLMRINRDRINVSSNSGALSLAIDMLQKQGRTKTLANPKIRVRNLEKASIKIGERVPIVTTTNANGVVSESVSYQDVGLILRVEPRISLDDEVSVKVDMEVSNILSQHTTKTGLVAYSLGTRNAQTLMTARNSETQILAGLVKRSESARANGLPGLSRIPGLGRLFGSDGNSDERSEIVLLITPHIERNLDLPASAVSAFLTGTESNVTTEPLTLEAAKTARSQQEQAFDLSAPIGAAQPTATKDESHGMGVDASTEVASEAPAGMPKNGADTHGRDARDAGNFGNGMGMMRTSVLESRGGEPALSFLPGNPEVVAAAKRLDASA